MLILSLDVCRSYHFLMDIVWDTGLVIVLCYFKNHSDPLSLKYLNSQSLLETNNNKKNNKTCVSSKIRRFDRLIPWSPRFFNGPAFLCFRSGPGNVRLSLRWLSRRPNRRVKSKGIVQQKMPETFRFGNYTNLPKKNGKSPLKKHLGTFFRLRKYCNLICPSAICGGGAPHTQEKKH